MENLAAGNHHTSKGTPTFAMKHQIHSNPIPKKIKATSNVEWSGVKSKAFSQEIVPSAPVLFGSAVLKHLRIAAVLTRASMLRGAFLSMSRNSPSFKSLKSLNSFKNSSAGRGEGALCVSLWDLKAFALESFVVTFPDLDDLFVPVPLLTSSTWNSSLSFCALSSNSPFWSFWSFSSSCCFARCRHCGCIRRKRPVSGILRPHSLKAWRKPCCCNGMQSKVKNVNLDNLADLRALGILNVMLVDAFCSAKSLVTSHKPRRSLLWMAKTIESSAGH